MQVVCSSLFSGKKYLNENILQGIPRRTIPDLRV